MKNMTRRGIRVAALVALTLGTALVGPQPTVLAQAQNEFERILITAGRSTVLTTAYNVTRIAVTNPDVADAVVVQPREILIDGKAPGTISLIVWGDGVRVQYDVVVEPAVTNLQQRLQALFPGEAIEVNVTDDAIILSGNASTNVVMLRAGEIAQASAPDLQVINMLQLPGGQQSEQVLLQVRFAEVNRRALTELGVSLFTGPTGFKDWIGRSSTQQFAAPDFDELMRVEVDGELASTSGEFTFSDFLNLFIFSNEHNVGGVLKALESKGFLQSLAEPNLIAYNGQEASFLAGGEFPVPVVQGATGTVSILFKEFGVKLTFTPTIAGDTIRLKVRPEVSSLDFANGITLQGFRVPALITRRAETDVELRDGQSFAIAGLLNNLSQEDRASIPILGSLPIIGPLFRSKAERQEQTELMVVITPRLVRPLNPDEVPPLPNELQRFLQPDERLGQELQGGGGAIDAPERPALAGAAQN